MIFVVDVYYTEGPHMGEVKDRRFFYTEEEARRFFRRVHKLNGFYFKPTFWVVEENWKRHKVYFEAALSADDEIVLVYDEERDIVTGMRFFDYGVKCALNPMRYNIV